MEANKHEHDEAMSWTPSLHGLGCDTTRHAQRMLSLLAWSKSLRLHMAGAGTRKSMQLYDGAGICGGDRGNS